ncbi:hypothetical protein BJF83_00900 [Nocardiopsis sp. CNR-923]|uniref:hypothetical protein n=1 Tax=Nocardiopsis sp. CNR-923 TaxID=1904965 RepID=UPI00095D5E94|nr:hypothetical protein [Nocardiopsis sp. CNR-923]OLT29189.1 hypothetical protein BJF83_00900 [Nocardiopsis sp. CNR-923]
MSELVTVLGEAALDRINALADRVRELEHRVSALEDPVPAPGTSTGMAVGWRGQDTSWPRLIEEAQAVAERPMSVRRVFDRDVPATFSESHLRHDHGRRVQVWSFKPEVTTSFDELVRLFASVPDRSNVWVIPFHEPRDNMSAQDYHVLYRTAHQAYSAVGGFAGIGPCLTNWGVRNHGELEYAIAGLADFLAVDTYVDLEGTPEMSAVEHLREALDFANGAGLPFAVAEFGVDHDREEVPVERKTAWLRSFAEVGEHAEHGLAWLCYFHSDVGGNFLLDNHPDYVAAYRHVWDAYAR